MEFINKNSISIDLRLAGWAFYFFLDKKTEPNLPAGRQENQVA